MSGLDCDLHLVHVFEWIRLCDHQCDYTMADNTRKFLIVFVGNNSGAECFYVRVLMGRMKYAIKTCNTVNNDGASRRALIISAPR